jgi:prefoldin subunit 5
MSREPSPQPGAQAGGSRASSSAEEDLRQATQALEALRDRLRVAGAQLVTVESEGGEDDETAVPISAVIFCVVLDHLDPAIADLRSASGDLPGARA